MRIAKYDEGDYFKEHRDGAHRKLSFVIYLNDDFDGGGTQIY